MEEEERVIERPLMFEQVARELAPTQRETLETAQHESLEPAYHPGTPPTPGTYRTLNTIDVFDDGALSYIHREDQWDGERWVTQGGYVRVVGWCECPEVIGD